jgi:hypothetical protein
MWAILSSSMPSPLIADPASLNAKGNAIEKIFTEIPFNPLKSLDSDEKNQENPNKSNPH